MSGTKPTAQKSIRAEVVKVDGNLDWVEKTAQNRTRTGLFWLCDLLTAHFQQLKLSSKLQGPSTLTYGDLLDSDRIDFWQIKELRT